MALDATQIFKFAKDPENGILTDDVKKRQLPMLGTGEIRDMVIVTLVEQNRFIDDAPVAAPLVVPPTVAPISVTVSEEEEPAPAELPSILMVYPPYSTAQNPSIGHALVGRTISQAIASMRGPWSIEQHPRVYLNGTLTSDLMHVLRNRDRLELQKASAEKGR
ncbi:MAG: hypothetical protein Q8P82_01305 [bacterium]|nr:hypothetical protein [bacterium]